LWQRHDLFLVLVECGMNYISKEPVENILYKISVEYLKNAQNGTSAIWQNDFYFYTQKSEFHSYISFGQKSIKGKFANKS